jgi:hypothetical protein
MVRKIPSRRLATLSIVALSAFLVLVTLAAAAYPGGTYCEPAADRYRFWGNYFCDLTAPVTGRGEDNSRTAELTEAAFACFALAAAPFFTLLGRMSGRARVVGGLGVVSATATVVLAWLPSRAGPTLHAVAVFAATIPGLAAAALGVYGLCSRQLATPLRIPAYLGVATFCAGLVDATGFGYALATHAGCLVWLPALQKVVALLLVAWMAATAWVGGRVA